jgi:hypothetical protein
LKEVTEPNQVPLVTSARKERAVVVVEERTPRRKKKRKGKAGTTNSDVTNSNVGKGNGVTPLSYSGRVALRREQCEVFASCKSC